MASLKVSPSDTIMKVAAVALFLIWCAISIWALAGIQASERFP